MNEQNKSVHIKKAKVKDDLFLEGEINEDLPQHSKKNSKFMCTVPVHDDLKTSFSKLTPHLALLCDEIAAPKKKDFSSFEVESFFATGFSIGGSDDNEGVTISGYKEGKYGRVNLVTPFTKYEEGEYPFKNELSAVVSECINEVEEYLYNGKRAPERQLGIDFQDDETQLPVEE